MTSPSAERGKAGVFTYPVLPFFCLLLLIVSSFFPAGAGAQSPLPVIPRLDSRDTVFAQYLSGVEAARRLLFSSRGNPPPPAEIAAALTVFSYTPGDGEEIMAVAARCSVPYSALATLNRFSHPGDMAAGKLLLLPSVPGIFVPETPRGDLEKLLRSTRGDGAAGVTLSIPREGGTERFLFIPGDDFTPVERVFFLNRGFRFPLERFEVTSVYGPRINPVTGRPGTHRGIDLAAPAGTEVFAVKGGKVTELGEDAVYGKYVIISHENNWVSLYGHLSSIAASLHSEQQSGSLIGRVGSTGQSTGPHLHFELLQNGRNRDPARLLGIFKENSGQ